MLWLCFCSFAVLASTLAEENFEAAEVALQFERWALNVQEDKDVDAFNNMIESMSLREYLPKFSLSDLLANKEKRTCVLCKASMGAGINAYRQKKLNHKQLHHVSMRLCTLISGYEDYVCEGLVNLNLPIFLYIVDHDPHVNASAFCGLIYQSKDANDCPLDDERFEFTVDIPDRPNQLQNNKNSKMKPMVTETPLKIVHLSDAHIDPNYEPNSPANCQAPCCCRKGQNATSTSTKAGYWGDYGGCDTPTWAFTDILDHVKNNHKDIDIVYYTGDMIDHGMWETTYESCSHTIRYISAHFKEAFRNTPLYPIIGNHDAQPMNVFAPENITQPSLSTDWLYTLLSKEWSQWLPRDAFETIKLGGYYTVLVKPGFRIIALNTNVAYRYNWWIVMNPKDPNNHLKWLVKTLQEAEEAGEVVHILSHVPPGTIDIYRPWGREYKKIIDRFSDIIAAEFNGHKHTDQFKIFYDNKDIDKATHVAWNGGSMATHVNYNVNYKVMSVENGTYIPLDIDTYFYNLTEANLTPEQKPRWRKAYSFKEAYEVDSLGADDINKLVNKMATTRRDLLNKYIVYFGKAGDAYLKDVKDGRRKLGLEYDFDYICNIVTTSMDDKRKCDQLKMKFEAF